MRLAGLAYQSRVRTLTGMRGLGAFDPRTRSLNGLACACQQKQNMARLGRLAGRGGANPLFRGVGRFGRLRGFGDDFTDAENLFLDTGVDVTPGIVPTSSTYDNYSNTLTPPASTLPLLTSTPQQIAAQQIWGTTRVTPQQNQALIAAQTAGYNLFSLTPQQIASIKSAGGGSSLFSGTSSQSVLFFGAAAIGLIALIGKK